MAIGLTKRTTDLDGSTVIARTGVAVQSGTQAEHDAYTGELGEITYNTTDDRLHIHDGSTAGGIPLARESENTTAQTAAAPVGGDISFATGLGTVASAGAAVKLVVITAARGNANGFTLGTDGILTASFVGTKLCHINAGVFMDVASGTDNLTLHLYVNGSSVYETSAISITAAAPQVFSIDILRNISNGDTIELYVENEDTTENITTNAFSDPSHVTPQAGFLQASA